MCIVPESWVYLGLRTPLLYGPLRTSTSVGQMASPLYYLTFGSISSLSVLVNLHLSVYLYDLIVG